MQLLWTRIVRDGIRLETSRMLLVLEWGSPQSLRCHLTSLQNFSYNKFPDNLFISKDDQTYWKSSAGLQQQPQPSPVAQVWNIWIAQSLTTPGRPWVLAEVNIIRWVFLKELTYFLSSLHLLQYIIILHSCQKYIRIPSTLPHEHLLQCQDAWVVEGAHIVWVMWKKNSFFFQSQTPWSLAKLLWSGNVTSLSSVMLLFPQSQVGVKWWKPAWHPVKATTVSLSAIGWFSVGFPFSPT